MGMSLQENLARIRPILQKRAAAILARGAGVRENFQEQLTRFFDLLEQALESGNATWLDPLLYDWTRTRTETDLKESQRNITTLLSQIVLLTQETACDNLSESQALELLSALLPIYLYCIERATLYENEVRNAYLTGEMEKMKRTVGRLDKSKSKFVAVAAHEFKTPLTLIEGLHRLGQQQSAGSDGLDHLRHRLPRVNQLHPCQLHGPLPLAPLQALPMRHHRNRVAHRGLGASMQRMQQHRRIADGQPCIEPQRPAGQRSAHAMDRPALVNARQRRISGEPGAQHDLARGGRQVGEQDRPDAKEKRGGVIVERAG